MAITGKILDHVLKKFMKAEVAQSKWNYQTVRCTIWHRSYC